MATKPKKKRKLDCLLNVGGERPKTVEALNKALMAVLGSSAGDDVKIAAVGALGTAAQNNFSITGCHFQSG